MQILSVIISIIIQRKVYFTRILKPKYAPIKVKGTDIPNHKAKMATRILKGTAAELPLAQNKRFIIKNKLNTIL